MRTGEAVRPLAHIYPHLTLPGPETVAELVTACFLGADPQVRLGGREEVVVFAVDGISFDLLREVTFATADLVIPYRSTFPSTSLVSWLSAVGVRPGNHPVVGPVFRRRAGFTANLIADKEVGWDDSADGSPRLAGGLGAATLFDTLRDVGLTSEIFVGDFFGISESWLALLGHGAVRRDPSRALDGIRLSPVALQEAAIDDLLARQRTGRAAVRWVYVNFDDRIHRTGYDKDVVAGLRHIARTAEELAGKGYTTFLHSDHGHIRNIHPPAYARTWAAVEAPARCVAPAGGAGRVRWLYPRPGQAESMLSQLRESFGEDVGVFDRDSEQWREFSAQCGNAHLTGDAVGEVIAVALTDRFPVPDERYVFEHGSICAEEMMTGVAAWSGV